MLGSLLGRANPQIVGRACPASAIATSGLALFYTAAEHHGPACFSGTGTTAVGGDPAFQTYCDGVDKGFLWIGGTEHAFTPGVHNLGGQHVSKVTITGTVTTGGGICSL